jgi:hypothetical protein
MDDLSIRIELEDEDLLDIDGSDDQTLAYSAKKFLRKFTAKNKRSPYARGNAQAAGPVGRESFSDIKETVALPQNLISKLPMMKPEPPPTVKAKAKKSPTISPAPERDVNGSYPPIAINVAPMRRQQMSFVSERPSRAGWITAAVIGVLIIVGGFIKVGGVPKLPVAAAEPPPAAVEQTPAPAPSSSEEKVVKFDDDQGIAIKKDDGKSAAHAKHVAPPPPAPKKLVVAAKAADTSLSESSKDSKKSEKADAKKKPLTIDQDLADAQLRAAAR